VKLWDDEEYRRDGNISDCTDGSAHKAFIEKASADNDGIRIITLTANMDGVKLFESGNRSMWPILLLINELPRQTRSEISSQVCRCTI
jgi:hypothetical protein